MNDIIDRRSARSCKASGFSLAVVMVSAMFASTSALAEPIALVLDKSEAVSFPAFSELSPGDVVELGNSGHIDLLDYSACREVRITAGRVIVSSEGYSLEGGEEKELRAGNCLQADSGTAPLTSDKGLTVTLRGLKPANKTAASLMLRFDDQLRGQYDTVFVAFPGAEPKRFTMGDNILTEMPIRDDEAETVDVELFFEGKTAEGELVSRKFTIDPKAVGRKTAVVLVK